MIMSRLTVNGRAGVTVRHLVMFTFTFTVMGIVMGIVMVMGIITGIVTAKLRLWV
jgi:hypothetical protein